MGISTVNALPALAATSDPVNFDATTDAFVAALRTTFISDLNAFGTSANALAAVMSLVAAGQAFAIPYTFDTATADADPGAGKMRLNVASPQNTSTVIRAENVGADGATWSAVIASLISGTSATLANITLMKVSDPTRFMTFNATAISVQAGYTNITVANVSSNPSASPFLNGDSLVLKMSKVGDKGTTGNAGAGAITNVVTATNTYTFTNTRTLVQMTPTGFGATAILCDATTMAAGDGAHAIDNRSAFPIRITNFLNVLLGFVPPRTKVLICLDSAATQAGVWGLDNAVKCGIAATSTALTLRYPSTCGQQGLMTIDLDGDLEFIYGLAITTGFLVGVVLRRSTGVFGAVSTIRAVDMSGGNTTRFAGVKCTTTSALFASVNGTAFESVVVSVNTGTLALTVNTASPTTLAASASALLPTCGLVAIPSISTSFVVAYTTSAPAVEIRAISVSGTTPTNGAATQLGGNTEAIILPTADKVITASDSTGTATIFFNVYTVSGSTLTTGTGATATTSATPQIKKFFSLGARWVCLADHVASSNLYASLLTLTTTTVTTSNITVVASGNVNDAIVVNGKVLVSYTISGASPTAALLTDTAGTLSNGTQLTLTANQPAYCVYANGTTALVADSALDFVDCSGANPALLRTQSGMGSYLQAASNQQLIRAGAGLWSGAFMRLLGDPTANNQTETLQADADNFAIMPPLKNNTSGLHYHGTNEQSVWSFQAAASAFTNIVKYEAAP